MDRLSNMIGIRSVVYQVALDLHQRDRFVPTVAKPARYAAGPVGDSWDVGNGRIHTPSAIKTEGSSVFI
jgi:hypothetical protein